MELLTKEEIQKELRGRTEPNKYQIILIDEILKLVRYNEEFDVTTIISSIDYSDLPDTIPENDRKHAISQLPFDMFRLFIRDIMSGEKDLIKRVYQGNVEEKFKDIFILTDKGKRAKEVGGYDNLLKAIELDKTNEKAKEQRLEELVKSTIQLNKSTESNFKIQKRISYAIVLLTMVTAGISWLDYDIAKKNLDHSEYVKALEKEIKQVKDRQEQQDSLNNRQVSFVLDTTEYVLIKRKNR